MSTTAYDVIRTRRVTRAMTDEPITADDLELVVRSARYAPSAGNRRLQPVLPITDPSLIRLIRAVSPGMLPLPQAVVVICIDRGRAVGYGFRPDAPGLYVDVGTTAATMMLATHAIGLGACPVSSFSKAAVAKLLELDTQISPQMLICLGHPAADQPLAMGAWVTHTTN
jgi:nitroreductase